MVAVSRPKARDASAAYQRLQETISRCIHTCALAKVISLSQQRYKDSRLQPCESFFKSFTTSQRISGSRCPNWEKNETKKEDSVLRKKKENTGFEGQDVTQMYLRLQFNYMFYFYFF